MAKLRTLLSRATTPVESYAPFVADIKVAPEERSLHAEDPRERNRAAHGIPYWTARVTFGDGWIEGYGDNDCEAVARVKQVLRKLDQER
jgi:hypothetical protein